MLRWWRSRLQNQLIAAFAAVIVLPTAIIALYSLGRTSEILIDMARLERLRGATVRANTAVRSLADISADLEYVAQAPAVRRTLNARSEDDRAQALRDVERFFVSFLTRWAEKYTRLCMLDSGGREVGCVQVRGGRPQALPATQLANRSSQPFFAGAMSLRAIPGQQPIHISDVELSAIGDTARDEAGTSATLRYATALQTDTGLLNGVIALDALVTPILAGLQSGAGGGATYVVDREGHYLLHPDPSKTFGHLRGSKATLRSERPRDAAVVLDKSSGTLYASADRPDSLQVFTRVRPPGQSNIVWTLIDEQSLDTILGDVRHTRAVILAVSALALVLAAGAAVAITRGIVRPIGALAHAAEAIRHGKLDAPLPVAARPDEVGVLTQAFAQMAERLRSLVGALQQRVQELEQSDAALRVSETRLRQMIDTNLAGIMFIDLSGHVLEANDAFLRIVGYDRADLRAGRIVGDTLTPPEYREVTAAAIVETRERGACTPYEKEYVRKDGSRVPVLVGIALVDEAGEQAAAFVLDQTARKQAEADREARLAAEASNRAKSEFLARMSHELRTPLNAILGFAQILNWDTSLSERARNGVAAIQHGGEHLLQLIVDLLDLSRIEAGRFQLDLRPTDTEQLLAGVRDIAGVKAQQKSLQFVTEIGSGLPKRVRCDPLRLRQVLVNLLGNAVKFTDRGEVRLRVQCGRAAGGRARLRFDVTDSGVGIAEHDVARLFLPFEQVGDSRRHEGGSGLGLAISQQLVQQMGGHIAFEPMPEGGSRFWFELPLPVVEFRTPGAAVSQSLPSGYAGRRHKILVVDNEPFNRALLVDLLGVRGFDVCEAADGEQALAATRHEHPDLILMDVAMPVMDGLQATHRLRAMPECHDLRIVCVSAGASDGERRAALAAGADSFVSKPLDIGGLLQLIGELLALQWTRDTASV